MIHVPADYAKNFNQILGLLIRNMISKKCEFALFYIGQTVFPNDSKKMNIIFFSMQTSTFSRPCLQLPAFGWPAPPLGSDILYGWLLAGSNLAQLYSTALNRINLAVMCTFSNQLLNNLSVTNVSLNNFCKKELKNWISKVMWNKSFRRHGSYLTHLLCEFVWTVSFS